MKELTIIRHAKSEWGETFVNDSDRHLSERGLRDAYFMSEWYAKHKTAPSLIITSAAARALNTALIFAHTLKVKTEHILLESKIYEAEVNTLFSVIKKQDNTYQHLMVFGHNPGLTNLCNELSADIFFDNLPTCAMVSYQFNIKSWKDLGPGKGKLNFYEFPKNFKS